MRVLIFGGSGRVGRELTQQLSALGLAVIVSDRKTCNMLQAGQVSQAIKDVAPDIVINATAMNGMEACEEQPDLALLINAVAPGVMARVCRDRLIQFVHYSTDYVFAGDRLGLIETSEPNPSGAYGWSKHQGEVLVQRIYPSALIFRLSSIYGRRYEGPLDPVRQAREGKGTYDDPIKVLHQFTAPTSARMVAQGTLAALEVHQRRRETGGIYHLATRQGVWKIDLATKLVEMVMGKPGPMGRAWNVQEGSLAVPRPVYSQLLTHRFQETFGWTPPSWIEDLEATLPMIEGDEKGDLSHAKSGAMMAGASAK